MGINEPASPFKPDLLSGRVAMVTGAGTGIGKVVALELARHGADLLLAARSVDRLEAVAEEIRALGRRAVAAGTDVSDPKQVKAAVETAESELGPLEILVNNAAANFIRPSRMLTAVRWNKVVDIVLNGTFYGCLEAGKRMIERGRGSIVNIVAAYAWTGAPGLAPSASAKAGVVTLTRSLGAEWAPHGVRVNAIAPGLIDTPQTRERLWPEPEMVKRMLKTVPAGGFGSEFDVSNLVLYLSSDAGAYITGEVVTADGGQSLGKGAMDMLASMKAVRGRKPGGK
jgi:NAD(P)-dependent dehydrogenase (short-subunit alcohol dehydrogenase family)